MKFLFSLALLMVIAGVANAQCTSAQLLSEWTAPTGVITAAEYQAAYGNPIPTTPTPTSSGNDIVLRDLMNTVRADIEINRQFIEGAQFQTLMNRTEFNALTQLQLVRLQTMFIVGGGRLDVRSSNVRNIIDDLFPTGGPTFTAARAFINRNGSRAEQLCGRAVTLPEVSLALRGTQ